MTKTATTTVQRFVFVLGCVIVALISCLASLDALTKSVPVADDVPQPLLSSMTTFSSPSFARTGRNGTIIEGRDAKRLEKETAPIISPTKLTNRSTLPVSHDVVPASQAADTTSVWSESKLDIHAKTKPPNASVVTPEADATATSPQVGRDKPDTRPKKKRKRKPPHNVNVPSGPFPMAFETCFVAVVAKNPGAQQPAIALPDVTNYLASKPNHRFFFYTDPSTYQVSSSAASSSSPGWISLDLPRTSWSNNDCNTSRGDHDDDGVAVVLPSFVGLVAWTDALVAECQQVFVVPPHLLLFSNNKTYDTVSESMSSCLFETLPTWFHYRPHNAGLLNMTRPLLDPCTDTKATNKAITELQTLLQQQNHANAVAGDSNIHGLQQMLCTQSKLPQTATETRISTRKETNESCPLPTTPHLPVLSYNMSRPFEVCFVSCIYAAKPEETDRLHPALLVRHKNPKWRFFLYTNLDNNMTVPGWTVRHHVGPYRRFITQSRWGKFMAWQDPLIQHCQMVVYHDAPMAMKWLRIGEFMEEVRAIEATPSRLGQYVHDKGGTVYDEFQRIRIHRKDIDANIKSTLAWLEAQPDFHVNATIFFNGVFVYDPLSPAWRSLTTAFWNRYSMELGSWRDQPLWSYAMHHCRVDPHVMSNRNWWLIQFRNRGHAGHTYSAANNEDAAKLLS